MAAMSVVMKVVAPSIRLDGTNARAIQRKRRRNVTGCWAGLSTGTFAAGLSLARFFLVLTGVDEMAVSLTGAGEIAVSLAGAVIMAVDATSELAGVRAGAVYHMRIAHAAVSSRSRP